MIKKQVFKSRYEFTPYEIHFKELVQSKKDSLFMKACLEAKKYGDIFEIIEEESENGLEYQLTINVFEKKKP